MKKDASSSIALSILPEAKDVFRYKMLNTFSGPIGLLRLSLSALLLVLSFVLRPITDGWICTVLLVLGLLNPVASPILILLRSGPQARRMPRTVFVFIGDRINLSDSKARNQLNWSQLYRIVCSKHLILLYLNAGTAFVIPRSQLGEQGEALMQLIRDNSDLCPTVYKKLF